MFNLLIFIAIFPLVAFSSPINGWSIYTGTTSTIMEVIFIFQLIQVQLGAYRLLTKP